NPCAEARQQVASLIGAQADEIIFTSGATETDNLAIKGVADANKNLGRHIITCVTEHKAVLDTCRYMESHGFEITYLPVDEFGRVRIGELAASIRRGELGTVNRTILVSIMGANNEI